LEARLERGFMCRREIESVTGDVVQVRAAPGIGLDPARGRRYQEAPGAVSNRRPYWRTQVRESLALLAEYPPR